MNDAAPATPDRWSLKSWFSDFLAPDYHEFKAQLVTDLDLLRRRADSPEPDSEKFAQTVSDCEAMCERFWHISSYLGCLSADDATNESVKTEEAWASTLEAEVTKLKAALQGALAALSDDNFTQVLAAPALAGIEHSVGRMREEGRLQMAGELEGLAADLNVNGLHAWGRLYDTLTGKLSFDMTFPDG